MDPEVGLESPKKIFNKVDFPAPEKPKIVYGPESYQAHTNECLYLTEAQKGVWIGVTPQNSEAEPRANEELWLLKFHHYIFINVSIDALPIIKKMNTEGESYGWN